jgi:hypothetical protein
MSALGWRDKRAFKEAARRGEEALDAGDLDDAESALRTAVELDPDSRLSWYNLALVHKFRRDWPSVLSASLRAVPSEGTGRDDPAWWNLGIAATALSDWTVARRAWRSYGVRLPDGEGEIETDLGMTPVRINPDTDPEVVWGVRLDPARARLLSVPLPESDRRWGDIVLHDGEPRGERVADGRTYFVFDELELWRRTSTPTFSVNVDAADESDVDALTDAADAAGGAAEDWSALRLLCVDCSLGRPHADHSKDDWRTERRIGVALPADLVEELLNTWRDAAPKSRTWRDLTEV